MWRTLSLMLVEIFLGKKLSVFYGLAIKLNFFLVLLIVFFWEFIQIPLFYYIFEKAYLKVKFLGRFRKNLLKKSKKQRIFKYLSQHGIWGVAIFAFYPFVGGGIVNSIFLADTLKLNKKRVYIIVIISTILSLLLLAGLSTLILKGISPSLEWVQFNPQNTTFFGLPITPIPK